MKILTIAALLLLSAGAAKSDTLWLYQGQSVGDPSVGMVDFVNQVFVPTPNPCGCALSGSLTLSAGVPVAWDFTAGAVTLTNLDSSISLDDLAWVGNPNLFSGWMLQIVGQNSSIFSSFSGSNFEATDGVILDGQTYQYVQGNHGIFTDPAATPEPSSAQLMALGLALLIGAIAMKDKVKRA